LAFAPSSLNLANNFSPLNEALYASSSCEALSKRNTMKLVILLSSTILFLSGCVNIKAPDNLVSDTVDASKNIYNSVKGKLSKDEPKSSEGVFSYSYEIPNKEPITLSTAKCMDFAIEEAKKTLNKYNVSIKTTESHLETIGKKSILQCSVSI
jgi:hypothetical protein